ncbi:MAG: glycosyltransferase family 2 protein [Planctomycetota bacterium]
MQPDLTPWIVAISVLLPLCLTVLIFQWVMSRSADKSRRMLPTLASAVESSSHWLPESQGQAPGEAQSAPPSLAVVVSAHNEAHAIGSCLRSLRAQDLPGFRVIVCLDRCTDGTADAARQAVQDDSRFELVEIHEPRPGWRGKPLPMQVGAEYAGEVDWILFLDADARLSPDTLRLGLAVALREGFDLMSVLPLLDVAHWFDKVMQPAATVHMLYLYPPRRVNLRTNARAFAVGAFSLIRREAFEAIDGMTHLRNLLTEDIEMARRVRDAGYRVGMAHAEGRFVCAMYETLKEWRTGWRRIFTGASRGRADRLRNHGLRSAIVGVGAPLVRLVSLVVGLWAVATGPMVISILGGALAVVALGSYAVNAYALGRFYRESKLNPLWVFLYPVGAAYLGYLLLRCARDVRKGRVIGWAGNTFSASPEPDEAAVAMDSLEASESAHPAASHAVSSGSKAEG